MKVVFEKQTLIKARTPYKFLNQIPYMIMEDYDKRSRFYMITLFLTFTCTFANNLHSCLTSNGVKNFTMFSQSLSSDYHRYLYLPMQNLIFADATYLKPSTIILPHSKEQLADAIICCRKGLWTIRLRSGGHSFEGLSHFADTPFVIIDLMNLNRVEVDLDLRTAWVESGATVGEMYYAISEASSTLAFPAGWCPTVGVGGHFSGGGYGLMTRKYGLAADNVIDAILVSSDGRVLDRNGMGEDVFWAIRGGGGGVWGAVYAWRIQLLPIPATVTTISLQRNSTMLKLSELVYKWQFVAPILEDDLSLAALVTTDKITLQPSLKFFGLFLGKKSMVISSVKRTFPELKMTEEECKEMNWIDASVYLTELDNVTIFRDRFSSFEKSPFKVKVDYVKDPISVEGISSIMETMAKQPNAFIVLNGQGGIMKTIPTDAIPFPHRDGNIYTIDYIVVWSEEEDSGRDEFAEWLRKFYDFMQPFVSKNPRVGYVNYADLEFGGIDWNNKSMWMDAVEIGRTWGERYFLLNYDRLVRAKTIIDPENVFHHPQSIPPLPQNLEIGCNIG